MERLYTGQCREVITDKVSKSFCMTRGTKQGDPLRPMIFNAVLESIMRRLKRRWASEGLGLMLGREENHRLLIYDLPMTS